MKQSIFFVFDEESMLSFDDAPNHPPEDSWKIVEESIRPYFKVYDAEFVEGQYDEQQEMARGSEPGDDGTMKIAVMHLRHFIRVYFSLNKAFLRFVSLRISFAVC
jgi:hypothetical protein